MKLNIGVLESFFPKAVFLYVVLILVHNLICLHTVNDNFGSSTTYDRSSTYLKFDPTRVRTHDFQIMTVQFMSLGHLLSPLGRQ